MSVLTQSNYRDGYSPFDHFITGDWTICRNCFVRTHEVLAEYDPDQMKQSLRGVLTADVTRTDTASTDYIPDLPAADCQRTMCGECGSDRKTILKRPVRKSTAIRYAENLSQRVEEIPSLSFIEDGALVAEVERLKTDGDHSSDGNGLFDQAFRTTVIVDFGRTV